MMMTRAGACEVCSAFWVTGLGRAETIGKSEEFLAEIRRCCHRGAYREVGAFSNPIVISREQASRELPGLVALEAALGIDFPDPPFLGESVDV